MKNRLLYYTLCYVLGGSALFVAAGCASTRSSTTPARAPSAEGEPREHAMPVVRSLSFDDEPTGRTPRGFAGAAGQWQLIPDHTSRGSGTVLAQLGESADDVFNVVLLDHGSYQDIDVSVRLKAVAGEVDQGGGVVWRARDASNYYIARYNPLEDNYRVYTVKDGRRRMLQSASLDVAHDAWHTLRVRMIGDRIECFLDGQRYLEVRDETFPGPGRIGLWTKADARSHFDDLELRAAAAAPENPGDPLDAEAIGGVIGTSASVTADGVVRVTWPRTSVSVRIDGMLFPPPAGLTSWAAFSAAPHGAMMMGDTVVFQDEVSPAMDAAFAHGLEITGLHNHFFFDEPKVYFMHIGGHGDPDALARGVKAVWDAIREVRRQRPQPASTFPGDAPRPGGTIDAAAVGRIIGVEPTESGGVVKVTIGREAAMHGMRFSGSMGLTTWAAFTGSNEHAAIDGDFAMTANEVQPVLRALRRAGIHVVALHNHMIGEDPAYYFTHFWAKGPATDLARGFRAALDAQREVGDDGGR